MRFKITEQYFYMKNGKLGVIVQRVGFGPNEASSVFFPAGVEAQAAWEMIESNLSEAIKNQYFATFFAVADDAARGKPHACVELGNGMSRLRPYEGIDYATDAIMDTVDDLFLRDEFDKVDEMLPDLEPNELGIDLTIVWLVSTMAAKDKLSKRSAFVDKAIVYFQATAPLRAANLLGGLV